MGSLDKESIRTDFAYFCSTGFCNDFCAEAAESRLMHCSKTPAYSITSSARASSVGGTKALAVSQNNNRRENAFHCCSPDLSLKRKLIRKGNC
jgi:hypothetical protein